MVCFIHRPEYYKIYKDQHGNDLHGIAEIIIAKHRNGAVGDVRMRFIGEYARFANRSEDNLLYSPSEEADVVLPSRMNQMGGSGASFDGNDSLSTLTADMAPRNDEPPF